MSNQSPPSGSSNDLFEQFTVPALDQWREEVERLLKGAPFARKMFSKTLEGITVGPMYTGVDTADLPWQENLPGQWPHLRGSRAASNQWLVAQELPLPTTEEFNKALQSDLKRGQTAVNLVLDQASRIGLDPDQAPVDLVGSDGTSLASMAELEAALDGVDLAEIPLFIQAGTASLPVAAMLVALLDKQGTDSARLQGCLGCDPVGGLAEKGKLSLEISRVYDELAVITRWAAEHAPQLKTLPVHESPWHDGGADGALSLALTLAAAVHTLRAMDERGVDLSIAASRVQFHLCIGSDFFMEMAKVRALRVLWSDVLAAAGCGESAAQVRIHARTSRRTQTKLDRQVNMLRVTTQAMSAVLGGVDSLHVSPFDEVDSIPDEFSRRIARNVQLILANECHFDQVHDPAGGSWYVEKLTADLAEKAWSIFQEIEAGGGIIEGLKSGWVQDRVAAVAMVRCDRLATRRDVLVGTNQYANPAEPGANPRTVDHAQLQARRTDDMARLRTSGEHEDHLLVLGRLEKIMDAGQEGLLKMLADATAHGATLGELTGILHHDTAPDLEVQFISLRRDAEPFEKLRREVELLKDRGRVFVACLGDVARYMPRLEFTRRFFKVAGFTLVEEGFFTSADQAVKAAADSAAPVVVLTGLDTTYDEMAAHVLAGLKALSPAPEVLLAGGTAELISELEQAGLDRSINARSNLLEVLGQVAIGLGVQS